MTLSNEVVVAAEVLEDMLRQDNEYDPQRIRVLKGADPEARIIGVRFEADLQGVGSRSVVLVYDRPIPDTPVLQSIREQPRG